MPSEGVRRKEVETDPSFFDDIALTKWLFSTSTGELADRHGVLRAPRCAPAGQGDTISLVLDADAGRLSVVVKRTRHPGTISESECTRRVRPNEDESRAAKSSGGCSGALTSLGPCASYRRAASAFPQV